MDRSIRELLEALFEVFCNKGIEASIGTPYDPTSLENCLLMIQRAILMVAPVGGRDVDMEVYIQCYMDIGFVQACLVRHGLFTVEEMKEFVQKNS